MRRLSRWAAAVCIAGMLTGSACKRREPVRVQETDENEPILQSTVQVADPRVSLQLLSGFHQVEQNSWRWTKGKFSVTLRTPPGAKAAGGVLTLKFALPDAILNRVKSTDIAASVGQTQLGTASYAIPGEHTFKADVPANLLGAEAVTVDFSSSKFVPAGESEARELGLVVSTISLTSK